MSTSQEITRFQERCQVYFTCLTFATMGLKAIADKLSPGIEPGKDPSLFIGTGHPDDGKAHSKIKLKDAVSFSEKDGAFSDTLAKTILVTIYAEWDGLYRHTIAAEIGSDAKDIKSDLMGDLRHVRNCVVHNKSIVDKKCTAFKVLTWQLVENKPLKITAQMFSSLIDSINVMTVAVHAA